jgi:putative SOS response-associated peptidase YedK
MCCRCTLVKFLDEILAWFNELDQGVSDLPDLFENFNAAPMTQLPIVSMPNQSKKLDLMTWGLIPAWAKTADGGATHFNARLESIHEKKTFRHLTKRQRGILVCDGYFEWQKDGNQKYPYYIYKPGREIMPLACLWDEWNRSGKENIKTFTVITRPPTSNIAAIHDRMPLILNKAFINDWLNPESNVDLNRYETIIPYSDKLEFHTVSSYVNSVKNNSPKCIENYTYVYNPGLF